MKRIAKEIATLSSSLPLAHSSSIFLRVDEVAADLSPPPLFLLISPSSLTQHPTPSLTGAPRRDEGNDHWAAGHAVRQRLLHL